MASQVVHEVNYLREDPPVPNQVLVALADLAELRDYHGPGVFDAALEIHLRALQAIQEWSHKHPLQ